MPLANPLLMFKNICLFYPLGTGDFLMDVLTEDEISCTY